MKTPREIALDILESEISAHDERCNHYFDEDLNKLVLECSCLDVLENTLIAYGNECAKKQIDVCESAYIHWQNEFKTGATSETFFTRLRALKTKKEG